MRSSTLSSGRGGTEAHDPRLDAGGGHGDDARLGREAVLFAAASEAMTSAAAPSLTPEALPAVTLQSAPLRRP